MHLLAGFVSLANIVLTTFASNSCLRVSAPTLKTQFLNKILDNSTYFTLNTTDIKLCGLQCLRESQCQSVNFEPLKEICELNEQPFKNNTGPGLFPMQDASFFNKEDFEDLKVGSFSAFLTDSYFLSVCLYAFLIFKLL